MTGHASSTTQCLAVAPLHAPSAYNPPSLCHAANPDHCCHHHLQRACHTGTALSQPLCSPPLPATTTTYDEDEGKGEGSLHCSSGREHVRGRWWADPALLPAAPSCSSWLKIMLKLPTQTQKLAHIHCIMHKDKVLDSDIESEDDDNKPCGGDGKRLLTMHQAPLPLLQSQHNQPPCGAQNADSQCACAAQLLDDHQHCGAALRHPL